MYVWESFGKDNLITGREYFNKKFPPPIDF